MNNSATGLRLRERRQQLGLSQPELAKLLQVGGRARIAAWERDRTSIPAGVDADLFSIETILDGIVAIAVAAIQEGQDSSDSLPTVSQAGLARAAARADINLPSSATHRLAQRIQADCHTAGIHTIITT